jgi:hypothetical protein
MDDGEAKSSRLPFHLTALNFGGEHLETDFEIYSEDESHAQECQ